MTQATIPFYARLYSFTALMILAGAATAQAPAAAPAAPAPDWTHTGNVSLVSDYNFRGVSQTQGKPTAQATLDFSHSSGLYFGLFGSGVSHAAYNNAAGSEIDVYGGYRMALDADSNIDVGLVTYWFPSANYAAAGRNIKYHTQDLKIGYNRGAISAYAWLTVSKNWFGFAIDPISGKYADTKGTTYFEANWNPELAPGLTLNLHAGRQTVRNMEDFNFVDMKVGVSKVMDAWSFSLAATRNSGEVKRGSALYWTFVNADGSSKNVVGNRLLLTAGRNF
jgi:uncharacterized protein (TIGR02001 family)